MSQPQFADAGTSFAKEVELPFGPNKAHVCREKAWKTFFLASSGFRQPAMILQTANPTTTEK